MKMLKSFLSLLMVSSLFISTIAPRNVQAAVVEDYSTEYLDSDAILKDIFDQFHYTLEVEWDQQDENFKLEAEKDLARALEVSGLTPEEIQSYLTRNLLTGKIGQDFSELIEVIKLSNLTQEEADALTSEFLKQHYSRGASFNGEGGGKGSIIKTSITVVVVAVITAFVIKL